MNAETRVNAFVRAYTHDPGKSREPRKAGLDEPSEYSLIFDCETTLDATQTLRFGFFQVQKHGVLIREGVFYEPSALTAADIETIQKYAVQHGLDVCTAHEFRFKVFLRVGYEARAQIIGFNLPFDISRIATDWGEARGSLRGGFSFEISRSYDDPHVRVKHLSPTMALIDFAKPAGQDTPRGMRRRKLKVMPHRGYFYDVHTLAKALHGQNFTLGSLAKFLDTPTKKHEGVALDGPVTEPQLDYARADVQATWECFERVRDLYASYGLSRPLHRIQSEASIGKASLIEMGIRPLLECQPYFPRETFGPIMATYFGGRAESRIRRKVCQTLIADFKSMYPTVNTLMGLWSFIIGDGYTSDDSTEATQAFLNTTTLEDLQNPETWKGLCAIVQLRPDNDILPVRTRYTDDKDTLTIGLNYVRSRQPLWYTLADVLASKLLTGKTPIIGRAISFKPGPIQSGLKKLNLLGRAAYCVDPAVDDVFKRLVDLRDEVKATDKTAAQAIKTIVNSAAYGVSAEVNRDDAPKPEPIMVFGPDGESFLTDSCALEEPGKFFHPLLATLITGAARLMLAAAERVAADHGLGYVLCDTDSIAMAKPDDMSSADFYTRAQSVVDWFVPLNPYRKPGSILQIEAVNYGNIPGQFEPLYAYSISAKRYSLFNIDSEGKPIIRKFSAHGLGHLMAPYPADKPAKGVPEPIRNVSELGGQRWQYDRWYHILIAALAGKPNVVCQDYHPALSQPVLSRYSASSPALLRWLKPLNEGKSYADQVKPFGFMVAPMARTGAFATEVDLQIVDQVKRGRPRKERTPKPIAPFERDPAIAASRCFDRETGEAVPLAALKTYAEALALYHVSPEDKFENGGPTDVGLTQQRHLLIEGVRLIGKEANQVGEFGEQDPESEACVEFRSNALEAAGG